MKDFKPGFYWWRDNRTPAAEWELAKVDADTPDTQVARFFNGSIISGPAWGDWIGPIMAAPPGKLFCPAPDSMEHAEAAIQLFIEYRDVHGKPEPEAQRAAAMDMAEGLAVKIDPDIFNRACRDLPEGWEI